MIFDLEKRSALRNSGFIEDGNSDDENVSCSQWDRLDETMPNEFSILANFSGNDTADYEDADDNDLTNGSTNAHSNSNGFADDSVIVIDDD